MVRTQIQLDEVTYKEVKKAAYEQGKSFSEVVRGILKKEFLEKKPRKRKLTLADFPIAGKYDSGKTDISVRHDEYLDEDFE